jgi:glycosyltransferase involved in cell wall biosynthesis
MKALVISPQPFFTPRGTPFSVYYRTLVTAELGVKADILTYGEGQDVDIPGVRIIRIPRFGFLGNVKTGPSFLKLFLDVFMMLWTIGLLMRNRYDFVHAHEEAVFFCRFLKPFFGFKLVYDMHSSLPQQLSNFQFTKSTFLIGVFKKLEDSCLRSVDAVITICPDLADYASNLLPDKNKHILIENSIFDPIKTTCISNESSATGKHDDTLFKFKLPEGKHFVVYAGTLEPYQGIDLLISAFKNVKEKNPEAFLIVVGGTEDQVEHYLSLAEVHGLQSDIFFTGRVPKSNAEHYCKLAAVLVSPRTTGTNTPLKVYEQIASGIPLVATNVYSHTQVLNNDIAILVDPQPEDMARGILAALDGHGKRIATNAKHFYEENYSRPIYEQKMRHLLELLS